MFGFQPFSDQDISDISLPAITGYISATDQDDTALINAQALATAYISTTDQNDTATITAAALVTGSISTTDQNDTATINGAALVTGSISTTDENDTANINGNALVTGQISTTDENDTAQILGNAVITGYISTTDEDDTANIQAQAGVQPDTHDGFTKDEVKRYKRIQKKLAQAEAAKIQARLDKQRLRKQQIKDIVEPPVVTDKTTKVQSVSEVKIDKPSIDLKKLNATIINLERQKQELIQAVALRNEMARIQTQMAILEAKRIQDELDDEEALLLLI